MNKQSQTLAEKRQNPLSVGEYLWLQGKRQQLTSIELQLEYIKARQNRQAGWILLLIATVIVLASALLFVLIF